MCFMGLEFFGLCLIFFQISKRLSSLFDIYVLDMDRVARFGSNILCFGHDEIYCKFCIFRISDKVKNNNFVVNIRKNIDDSLIPKYWCMCYL